jgi:predicted ATP-dependent Lon-type protease
MAKEKRSFWEVLLGPYPSEREEKVLEYGIHRLGDIVRERYVRAATRPLARSPSRSSRERSPWRSRPSE